MWCKHKQSVFIALQITSPNCARVRCTVRKGEATLRLPTLADTAKRVTESAESPTSMISCNINSRSRHFTVHCTISSSTNTWKRNFLLLFSIFQLSPKPKWSLLVLSFCSSYSSLSILFHQLPLLLLRKAVFSLSPKPPTLIFWSTPNPQQTSTNLT